MTVIGSYRGCDTCRQWKKKCDKRKPKCSLCKDKNLPCEGIGLQRFKFRDHSSRFAAVGCQTIVLKSPSNHSTRLTDSLLSFFENPNQGYNSCWMIPEEFIHAIGSSPAVDKALSALLGTLGSIQPPMFQPNMLALKKYTHALAAVRKNISEPATRYKKETLIAVYLLTICEPWMTDHSIGASAKSNTLPGHLAALEHLASVLAQQEKKDELLTHAISKAGIQLLMEAPFNSEKTIPSWLWEFWKLNLRRPWAPPVKRAPRPGKPSIQNPWKLTQLYCFDLREFMRIPTLMRNPRQHIKLIEHYYHNIQDAYPICKAYCTKNPVTIMKGTRRADTRMQTVQGEAQTDFTYYGLMFNAFLRTLDPENKVLAEDRAMFCSDAVIMAEKLKHELPVSALEVPPALIAAWCVAEDADVRKRLRQLLDDYRYSWAMCHILHCIPNWKEAPKKLSREIPWIPPYKHGKEEWPEDFDTEMWKYCSVM